MGTLTEHRDHGRRPHLTLVPPLDPSEPTINVVVGVEDTEPGPRDAAEVVTRFAALLPTAAPTDVFSFGIA